MANYLIQPAADYDADPDDDTNAIWAVGVSEPQAAIPGIPDGVELVLREFTFNEGALRFTSIGAPINTVAPVISGGTGLGDTLTSDVGTWTGADSFAYQWLRNGVEIPDADGSTYTRVQADSQQGISLRVTASNANGSTPVVSNVSVSDNFTPGDSIAAPDPVTLNSTSPTQVSVTLPADPAATGVTINERVVALVPAAAYNGNEQDPAAWTAGGAQYAGGLAEGATHVFSGTYEGDYVVTWEARDTTTDPRTDSPWATGVPLTVVIPADPPVADTIVIGEQQVDGSVPLTITNPSKAAPDSTIVFVAVGETAPSTAQVRAGQRSNGTPAPIAGSFGVTPSVQDVTLSLPNVSGTFDVYVVLGDGDYSPTPIDAGQVTLTFAAAPVLSGLSGTETGATTATAAVTSDTANGTIFFGVRLAASDPLTAEQLIAQAGGLGLAWDSDDTPTADGNNAASFTGLMAETAYQVDAVQRNAQGTVGDVVSSATFTTDAAPATNAAFDGDATGTAFGTSLTFDSNSPSQTPLPAVFTAGKKLVAVNEGDGETVTGVVIDGVAATQRALEGTLSYWEADITGNTTNAIVVQTGGDGTNRVAVAMWDVTGLTFQSAANDTPADTSPRTATVTFTTSAGDVLVGAWPSAVTTPTYNPSSGATLRTDDLGNNGRLLTTLDRLNAAGGSPESFGLTASAGFTGATLLAVHYA